MAKYKSILASFIQQKDKFINAIAVTFDREGLKEEIRAALEKAFEDVFSIIHTDEFGTPALDLDFGEFIVDGERLSIDVTVKVVAEETGDVHRLFRWLDEGTEDVEFAKNSPYFDIRRPYRVSPTSLNVYRGTQHNAATDVHIKAGQVRHGMEARNLTDQAKEEINRIFEEEGLRGLKHVRVEFN